ncbi:uncharacterized protein GIQ15_03919 [Arthroderma uncinatum]|uniref:uncharacterized protein n=1 Tax=Arthroderma uncinatum TaxID=74035 RepID=UPI00144AC9BE|nr:uncharacterized protein GIQ15_03919 [Arthroderma uncinatum]KAF3481160.1 hypothetical protein GIQ15_03919 [Arthroderma uncinatum]
MSRMLIRQSRTVIRRPAIRHSSTAQETAAKAKDAASTATAKASEGLTKVTAAAGPAIAGAMSGVGGALKRVGGRTAKVVAFVEFPFLTFTNVGRLPSFNTTNHLLFESRHGDVEDRLPRPEDGTTVSQLHGLTRPVYDIDLYFDRNMATFQSYFYSTLSSLRQPSTIFASLRNPNGSVARLRSLDAKQWAIVGITTAEVIGFFSVGEMLGRFKVVGYRGEVSHEH